MPGDLLREWISNQRIDLHVLSAIAKRFQVSFEALCIRFIKFTPQRAILVYWDNGYRSNRDIDGCVRTEEGALLLCFGGLRRWRRER